jgi:hypothetical protein
LHCIKTKCPLAEPPNSGSKLWARTLSEKQSVPTVPATILIPESALDIAVTEETLLNHLRLRLRPVTKNQ